MPSRPMNWKAWIRACVKDESCPIDLPRVRYPLAPLTGQDTRALEAIVACWQLYASSDMDGQDAALDAVRALLPAVQPECRAFARELIPFALDWGHRPRLWAKVTDKSGTVQSWARAALAHARAMMAKEGERQRPNRSGDSVSEDFHSWLYSHVLYEAKLSEAEGREQRVFMYGAEVVAANDARREELARAERERTHGRTLPPRGMYYCPVCETDRQLTEPCGHIEITDSEMGKLRKALDARAAGAGVSRSIETAPTNESAEPEAGQ